MQKYHTIKDLINDYEYTSSGHFFSKDTMRFFKSKVLSEFKKVADGYLFVTSEQGPHHDKRVFTVRKATVVFDASSFYGRRIEIETINDARFTTRAKCVGFIKRSS